VQGEGVGEGRGVVNIRKQHLTLHNCLCIKIYLMHEINIFVAI
jgi:hypothetical protein